MRLEIIDTQAILESMSVKEFRHLYVLGCIETRSTFVAQQSRAINLFASLGASSAKFENKRVGIIGGGLAGMTAALAAVEYGAKEVYIFEKCNRVFSLQERSERFIHPNLYDWPNEGWQKDVTDLPFLNWKAAEASTVVKNVRKQWDRHLESRENLHALVGISDVKIEMDGPPWPVLHSDGEIDLFDIVVLAIGFGVEKQEKFKYWHNDHLKAQLTAGGNALISGRGDGGLTDCLRLAIAEFDHAWIQELAASEYLNELKPQLVQIEIDPDIDDDDLLNRYLALDVPPEFDLQLSSRHEGKVNVFLHCRTNSLTRRSSILNRFLVSRLIHLGIVTLVHGEHDFAKDPYPDTICGINVNPAVRVIRNGTEPALKKFSPEVWDKFRGAREFRLASPSFTDRNRIPIWTRIARVHPPKDSPVKWYEDPRYIDFQQKLANHLQAGFPEMKTPIVAIVGASGNGIEGAANGLVFELKTSVSHEFWGIFRYCNYVLFCKPTALSGIAVIPTEKSGCELGLSHCYPRPLWRRIPLLHDRPDFLGGLKIIKLSAEGLNAWISGFSACNLPSEYYFRQKLLFSIVDFIWYSQGAHFRQIESFAEVLFGGLSLQFVAEALEAAVGLGLIIREDGTYYLLTSPEFWNRIRFAKRNDELKLTAATFRRSTNLTRGENAD